MVLFVKTRRDVLISYNGRLAGNSATFRDRQNRICVKRRTTFWPPKDGACNNVYCERSLTDALYRLVRYVRRQHDHGNDWFVSSSLYGDPSLGNSRRLLFSHEVFRPKARHPSDGDLVCAWCASQFYSCAISFHALRNSITNSACTRLSGVASLNDIKIHHSPR